MLRASQIPRFHPSAQVQQKIAFLLVLKKRSATDTVQYIQDCNCLRHEDQLNVCTARLPSAKVWEGGQPRPDLCSTATCIAANDLDSAAKAPEGTARIPSAKVWEGGQPRPDLCSTAAAKAPEGTARIPSAKVWEGGQPRPDLCSTAAAKAPEGKPPGSHLRRSAICRPANDRCTAHKAHCDFHGRKTWTSNVIQRLGKDEPKKKKNHHFDSNGYIQCSGCKTVICLDCFRYMHAEVGRLSGIEDIWSEEPINHIVAAFDEHPICQGRSYKFIILHESLMPCCEWEQVNKAAAGRKYEPKALSADLITLDGLLAIPFYNIVHFVSRLSGVLEVIAFTRDFRGAMPAMQHSVLDGLTAKTLEDEGIQPEGKLPEGRLFCGMVEDPGNPDGMIEICFMLYIAKQAHPYTERRDQKGKPSHLGNRETMQQQAVFLTPEQEVEALASGCDVVLLLYEFEADDGRLLYGLFCARWIGKEWRIDVSPNGETEDDFHDALYKAFMDLVPKNGHEVRRFGGSSGDVMCDRATLNLFHLYEGTCPRKRKGVKLVVLNGKLHLFYVSPYKNTLNMTHVPYSNPVRGGQVRLAAKQSGNLTRKGAQLLDNFGPFLEKQAQVKTMTCLLLDKLTSMAPELKHVSVSPEAVARQRERLDVARNAAQVNGLTAGSVSYRKAVYRHMAINCAYTMVDHPMDEHVDVGQNGILEFLETKYPFRLRYLSTGDPSVPASGRGGFGRGMRSACIVDHH